MAKAQARIYKGTRDFLPKQMVLRNYVISIIKSVFEKYGFEPLETPSIEMWETLSGKYGDEGDQLTYRFVDRGKRDVGLRYDLTVPLSRVVAMNTQLPKPFKRYQIQPVWRADKPQKGRYREFYQCDADIIGTDSMLAETELSAMTLEILTKLGFNNYTVRINSRKVLSGIVEISGADSDKSVDIFRAIDKLDKIGFDGVIGELKKVDLSDEAIEKVVSVLTISGNTIERLAKAKDLMQSSAVGLTGISEVETIFEMLSGYDVNITRALFDPCLARGLDYYTGPIFETIVEEPKIGSISGGGRYDNLIGMFGGQSFPAVGTSVGLERIIVVMEELNMFPPNLKTSTTVLVSVFNEHTLSYSLKIAKALRANGINTDLYSGNAKLRGQFGYANDKGIPFVIVAGPDEMENNTANLKNMLEGTQSTVQLIDLAKVINESQK